LKVANQLLDEVKDHAETMSMRALFLHKLGEEDKALNEAKMAVFKAKMQSQLCWHNYGVLLHEKRDYQEAAKCYLNALRMDPGNAQIQRDTALMQIQLRDHVGHALSRFEILKTRPNLLTNWVSYALANHLKGDFDQVAKCLNSIEMLLINTTLRPVEMSGYLVYRCMVFQDAGQHQQFYDELKKN
jgi:tetratricopeptide (TPR) repeat protein